MSPEPNKVIIRMRNPVITLHLIEMGMIKHSLHILLDLTFNLDQNVNNPEAKINA